MYDDEKRQGLQRTISFVEIFANVKDSVFKPSSRHVSH